VINYAKITHIIAPFQHATDADWHAIDLFLDRFYLSTRVENNTHHHAVRNQVHTVYLWSAKPSNRALQNNYPIQEIKPYSGIAPNHGELIICGANTEIGTWFSHAQFNKVTIIHNVSAPSVLYETLKRLNLIKHAQTPPIQIAYVSSIAKQIAGLAGEVITTMPSPLRFKPITKPAREANQPFTVGKICIDMLSQHHYDDIALYESIAETGAKVSIAGGKCLSNKIEAKYLTSNLIQLDLGIQANQHAAFLSTLDCYIARQLKTVTDHYNYAVIEAMLSGVPVVCHEDLPVSQIIEHGKNGFIFRNNHQALESINTIKNNANLCNKVGIAAKRNVENLTSKKTI